jgi:hypothetical protein
LNKPAAEPMQNFGSTACATPTLQFQLWVVPWVRLKAMNPSYHASVQGNY